MATRAYVLIETAIGKTRDVRDALKKLPDMKMVDAVTGPYDIIALVESNTLTAVGDMVTKNIHVVPGITRTVTCLAIDMV
ncbi:MAG: Lrp/AsnC ligand binding domain-containing protein [Chloroflexi bacterium]|nr:Lrp/AsnC ligand binding domain-containing protein [Chloroflexota bacterium]